MDYLIPFSHMVDIVRKPVIEFQGERYFLVAQAWSIDELQLINESDEAFGYLMVRIDPRTGRGLPWEDAPLPVLH